MVTTGLRQCPALLEQHNDLRYHGFIDSFENAGAAFDAYVHNDPQDPQPSGDFDNRLFKSYARELVENVSDFSSVIGMPYQVARKSIISFCTCNQRELSGPQFKFETLTLLIQKRAIRIPSSLT